MTRSKVFAIACSLLLCGAAAASASPLVLNVTGNVFGTKFSGFPPQVDTGTLSGTVTFDSVTHNAIAANITATGTASFRFLDPAIPDVTAVPPPPYDPTAAPPHYSLVQNGFTTVEVVQPTYAGGGEGLNFTVSDALLGSSTGDPFTSSGITSYKSTSGNYSISGGMLTPALAATPEPSSIILLGTGALGLLGATRRRFPNGNTGDPPSNPISRSARRETKPCFNGTQ